MEQYKPKKLSNDDEEFERLRFTHYQSERASRFDSKAREAWELVHNAVDGTGTQYTQTQLNTLAEVGAPPVSMNYMYPILSQQKALLTADVPMGHVLPSHEPDKSKSYLYDKLCNAVWRKSQAAPIFSKAVKEMLICGISALGPEPVSFYRPGIFDLTINHVSCFDLFIDPDSKETGRNFRDAEAIYIARLVPERKIRNIFGYVPTERANELLIDVLDARNEEQDNTDILVRDVYEKMMGTYVICKVLIEGEWYPMRRVFEGDLDDKAIMKRLEATKKGTTYQIAGITRRVYVRRRTILGSNRLIYEKMLPLTEYPFAIFTPDDYTSPFIPSPATYLREPQKATNKFYQIVLLNALLSSNTRFMGPEGSFVDKDAWARLSAVAGNTYEYRADPNLPNAGKPEVVSPLPLNSAFYTLAFGLKDFSEYISGIFGVTQGDPNGAPDVYSSVQSLQNHSTMRSKDIRKRIEMSMSYMWKTVLEYLQFYGNRDEMLRYIDDAGELQEIPFEQFMDDNSIIEYDVQNSVRAQFPTDRQEVVRFLQNTSGQTRDPNLQRFLIEKSFEYMDMPIGDELKKGLDTIANMSQQIEALTKDVENSQALIKELSKEIIIGEKRAAVREIQAEVRGMDSMAKARAEMALGKIADGGLKEDDGGSGDDV